MILFYAFRNLFRNVRRTIAIVLTLALGSGALLAFQGFIHGVLTEYQDSTIHVHYGNGQIHTLGYRDSNHKEPWKYWIKNLDEVSTFLSQKEGVDYVFPRVSVAGMLTHQKKSVTGQGLGIIGEKETPFFNSLHIIEGEPLTHQLNGILLGKGLAESLNAHPGHTLTFYTKAFDGKVTKAQLLVTGVFETGTVEFDSRVFRISLQTAQKLLKTNHVESIAVGLNEHEKWEGIAQEVSTQFPFLEPISFAELDKAFYQHSVDWLEGQFSVVKVIILAIVLLGVFNTLSSSILERKQELGNLRANGESAFSVMRLILSEGLFLGVLASLLGLGLVYFLGTTLLQKAILMPPGPGSTDPFYITFKFTPQMLISTFISTALSALIACFLAGLKVVRMPIAKALRSY